MSETSDFTIGLILSLQTLCSCVLTTIGQYIYAYYLEIYPIPPNSTYQITTTSSIISKNFLRVFNEETKTCADSDIYHDDDAQAWAQQKSADLFFWINLFSSCPLILMTYIFGLYASMLGKRFLLILPMLGTLIQFAIWLAIIYFHLPDYYWYIAAIILGLSGSNGVLNFILTLMITDNTNEDDLSSRFVSLGAIQTGLSAIATFAIGYYIDWRGFIDIYWTGFVLELISILVVIFNVKSSEFNQNERTPLLNSTNDTEHRDHEINNCSHCFEVCAVFQMNRRTRRKSASLYLTLISNLFYMLASSSFAPFVWFLLNAPFCWSAKDIGNYYALSSISAALLSVIGMQLLTRIGANDAMICFISHIFFFASSIWSAFSRHDWELYAGLLISAFSGYQGSLTMSMMSKWLEPYERASAFTFVTEINTIVTTFGTTFFNWLYARTVVNYRNFTLLVGALLCIVPCIINLILFIITRKMIEIDLPTLSEADIESAPLRLPTNGPPHAGDAACILIPARSLTSSIRTPVIERSRTNSIENYQTVETTDSRTSDLIVL